MKEFKQVVVADRQSLVDIAIQEYGCYEGLFYLLDDNSDRLFAVDEVPLPGMKLNVRIKTPVLSPSNTSVVLEYRRKTHTVTSNAMGLAHIITYIADYVTTDYMDASYSTAPSHITTLQLVANIRPSYAVNTNNMGG